MNVLVINCSPVRTGATAEIVRLVSEQLSSKYSTKTVCIDIAFAEGAEVVIQPPNEFKMMM